MTAGTVLACYFSTRHGYHRQRRSDPPKRIQVIERLGKYRTIFTAGINVIIPIIDRPRDIAWRVIAERPNGQKVVQYKLKDRADLRETVFDFPKQGVITDDNVVTEINALIYFQHRSGQGSL